MTPSAEGLFYPKGAAAAKPASIGREAGILRLTTQDETRTIEADFEVEFPVGSAPFWVRFADGGAFESADRQAMQTLFNQRRPLANRLESRWSAVIILGAVLLLLIGGGTLAIKPVSRWAAHSLPESVNIALENNTYALLQSHLLEPTGIDVQTRAKIQAYFDRAADRTGVSGARLAFHNAPALGANAMALPAGLIICTDAMAETVRNEAEWKGLFYHELGHVKHRHALRGVLQNSVVLIALIAMGADITGGMGPSGVAMLLVQNGYSREFEREADAFAKMQLGAEGLDPSALGSLLVRLNDTRTEPDLLKGLLSSHPDINERTK